MNGEPTRQADFTHVRDGRPGMVPIGSKEVTERVAVAEQLVRLGPEVAAKFTNGDWQGPKGSVFQTAVIAGTMAVKKTSEWIPFCHPLPVESCDFDLQLEGEDLRIRCRVSTRGKTGVEMEAMTGAAAAGLTVYDMCKALSHAIRLSELRLVSKSGGKSGDYHDEREAGA